MKKLEEIPKKEIFTVPEGYFDKLPGIIQSRITDNSKRKMERPAFFYALRYAVAVVLLFIVAVVWFSRNQDPADAESLLSSIQTEDLIAYLNDEDVSTDEMLEAVGFSEADLEEIEVEVYELTIDAEQLKIVVEEMNSNTL
ncbi:MAG: hypothetical protein JNM57_02575 [Cyclobacteriaceae bacterium]|nr:hypothetical protein [Cyclobacteriaceae bacterium]